MDTDLYRQVTTRSSALSEPYRAVVPAFEQLLSRVIDESTYIPLVFPEYTPHGERHLANLFRIADKVLGRDLYERLNPAELVLLACGLCGHDWGMAVSARERDVLDGTGDVDDTVELLPNEPRAWVDYREEELASGRSADQAWADYVRDTHGQRSGQRLRALLGDISSQFADAVAKIAEGHTHDIREIRNPEQYPPAIAVLGETVNLAALASYVRLVDLLDIGEDRTPYALWKFVRPKDAISQMEWRKHRALSAPSVSETSTPRKVLISGNTDEPDVYARLKDLEAWVREQFAGSVALLNQLPPTYHLNLDSAIDWNIRAIGFEPISVRFEMDRGRLLDLLVEDLYARNRHVFLRELLQNSVDAIDTRQALSSVAGVTIPGHIDISIFTDEDELKLEWRDNGIGMDERVVQDFFARVGSSWYQSSEFKKAQVKTEPISRFGIGILSCFIVTETLEIRTRQDPAHGGGSEGLSIRIPSKAATFHVRRDPSIAVGTTVNLTVRKTMAPQVTAESVLQYLRDIVGYVRHRIRVKIGDLLYEIPSIDTTAEARPTDDAVPLLKEADLTYYIADNALQEKFAENVRVITLRASDDESGYQGSYSAFIPNEPARVYHDLGGAFRFADGTRLIPRSHSSNSASEAFVKGVGGFGGVGLGSSDDKWIAPRLLLDVARPSFLSLNLSRDRATLLSTAWLDQFWTAIGREFRGKIGGFEGGELSNQAMALGAALFFGQLPYQAVASWFEPTDWPVLLLKPGEGLVWARLADVQGAEAIKEAPIELDDSMGRLLHDSVRPQAQREGLRHWVGATSLVLSRHVKLGDYHPAQSAVLASAYDVLESQGYGVESLAFVTPSPSEAAPLVCRVWKKGSGSPPLPRIVDEALNSLPEARHARSKATVLNLAGTNMPQLVSFEGNFSRYAAVGSAFWNIDHPKIPPLVALLLQLSAAIAGGRVPGDVGHEYRINADPVSAGHYRDTARIDGKQFALGRFLRLHRLAGKLDLSAPAQELKETDFVPGTLDRYRRPPDYDFSTWAAQDSRVGAPL